MFWSSNRLLTLICGCFYYNPFLSIIFPNTYASKMVSSMNHSLNLKSDIENIINKQATREQRRTTELFDADHGSLYAPSSQELRQGSTSHAQFLWGLCFSSKARARNLSYFLAIFGDHILPGPFYISTRVTVTRPIFDLLVLISRGYRVEPATLKLEESQGCSLTAVPPDLI